LGEFVVESDLSCRGVGAIFDRTDKSPFLTSALDVDLDEIACHPRAEPLVICKQIANVEFRESGHLRGIHATDYEEALPSFHDITVSTVPACAYVRQAKEDSPFIVCALVVRSDLNVNFTVRTKIHSPCLTAVSPGIDTNPIGEHLQTI